MKFRSIYTDNSFCLLCIISVFSLAVFWLDLSCLLPFSATCLTLHDPRLPARYRRQIRARFLARVPLANLPPKQGRAGKRDQVTPRHLPQNRLQKKGKKNESKAKNTSRSNPKPAEKPASQTVVTSASKPANTNLAPPTKSVGSSESTSSKGNSNNNPSSANFTPTGPIDSTAACNFFMQALQTAFLMQSQGTLPARAGDTTGPSASTSFQQFVSHDNRYTPGTLPARAGDSTGPRPSAPATVSRAPDSPGPVGLPTHGATVHTDSASIRQSRSRIRERTSPRRREGKDIGSRLLPREPTISLGGYSDDELDYHRPKIASRTRNWGDHDSCSSYSPSRSVHSIRSDSRESIFTDDQPPSERETQKQTGRKDGQAAAELLIKYCPQLKAESTDAEGNNEAKPIFCLDSELTTHNQGPSAVKLDTPFTACYNKLAHSSLNPRSCRHDTPSGFRFDNKDFNAVFSTPLVPEAAYRVGDARARKSNFNGMRSRAFRKRDSQISLIDRVARCSMRLAAYQSYLITAQREADRLAIDKEDQKKISDLLLRISDLQFEQAARTALLCTKLRRAQVMEQLKLEKEADAILGKLPYTGTDLFAGKFQQVLEDTIAASCTADKTAYKLSKSSHSFRPSGEQVSLRSASFREGGSPQVFSYRSQSYNQSYRPSFDSRRPEGRERGGRPYRRPRGHQTASPKAPSAPQRGHSSQL